MFWSCEDAARMEGVEFDFEGELWGFARRWAAFSVGEGATRGIKTKPRSGRRSCLLLGDRAGDAGPAEQAIVFSLAPGAQVGPHPYFRLRLWAMSLHAAVA